MLLTLASIIVSVTASYFTIQLDYKGSDAILSNRLTAAETDAKNTEKRLDRFEDKLDALLQNEGINPARYESPTNYTPVPQP